MFEPDGWTYRARIGLLVPDGDVGPESEFSAMVPSGVGVNASRFRFPSGQDAKAPGQIGMTPIEAVAAPGPLDDAVRLIARAPVDVIALAFTSTSYIGGDGDDPRLTDRLTKSADGKPVVTTGQAILNALKHLDAKRIALVDPPWFPSELTAMGQDWLTRNGLSVVSAGSAGLPTGQSNIHPGGFYLARERTSAQRQINGRLLRSNSDGSLECFALAPIVDFWRKDQQRCFDRFTLTAGLICRPLACGGSSRRFPMRRTSRSLLSQTILKPERPAKLPRKLPV